MRTGERLISVQAVDTVAGLLTVGRDEDPALIDADGTELDWRTLRSEVRRLADQLRAFGIGAGDRLAIVLPNGPDMALMFLAAAVSGCVAPLNPQYRAAEFRYYLDDLGAKALITQVGKMPDARAAASSDIMRIAVSGDFTALRLDADAPRTTSARDPADHHTGLVLHTSGTTSRPKIVPLLQRNLAQSARNLAASLDLSATDRSLNVMPLFHIHGLIAGLLAPLAAGGSVVATPGFDPVKFHRWLDSHRPTYYTAVPTIHQMVLARAEGPRETTLRFVRSSSASLPVPVLEGLHDLFDVPVIEAYGMTEATHQMAANPLPPETAKPGSVGVATGIEMAILGESSQQLPAGVAGEVAIRGDTVVDGYENNPEANDAAFTDGWFRTGDEGQFDADGYLTLTGRIKEQINRAGEKVSPLEIDEVLLRHPAVAQAVAFAIPHPMLGEEVGAAVVLEEGAAVSGQELRLHVSQVLAGFKVPARILFVDEIPKGATGKVQRIGLAEKLGLGTNANS